jgi:hypothetical protein
MQYLLVFKPLNISANLVFEPSLPSWILCIHKYDPNIKNNIKDVATINANHNDKMREEFSKLKV